MNPRSAGRNRAWRHRAASLAPSLAGLCLLAATVGCGSVAVGRADAPDDSCDPVALVSGGDREDVSDLYRIDADGRVTRVTTDAGLAGPAVAPDGTWVAAVQATLDTPGAPQEEWGRRAVVLARDGTVAAQVAAGPELTADGSPSIAPTGDRFAFVRETNVDGVLRTELVVADRDGHIVWQVDGDAFSSRPAWSPDGSTIAVVEEKVRPGTAEYDQHLTFIGADGSGVRRVPIVSGGTPVFSPDGRRVVMSESSYEGTLPIVEVDVATGKQTLSIDQPRGASWTNAAYTDASHFRVLRFDQTVEPRPQRIEIVDRSGRVGSGTELAVVHPTGDPQRQVIFSELSTSRCFSTTPS